MTEGDLSEGMGKVTSGLSVSVQESCCEFCIVLTSSWGPDTQRSLQ